MSDDEVAEPDRDDDDQIGDESRSASDAPLIEGADEVADDESGDFEDEELSLDDLGAAYAKAAAEHDPDAFAPDPEENEEADEEAVASDDEAAEEEEADEDELVTPEAIIEGALFVGHPDNQALTEQRLASLIRDFTPEETIECIERLNESYREADQGIRIVSDEHGYRMAIAPEVEGVRRSFLGKVREARLSQSCIEVLSLVAYQPGINAQKVQDQRGRESGSLLNQLVRRQLLRIERVKPEKGGRAVPHYYPTERFLVLFGIESLDELPQVEEGLREG